MANSSGRVDFWDAEKMLDLYLHDYMVKKNMHSTAEIFRREADVYSESPVVIDTKEGFLNEWWTLFYDVYSSRAQLKHQDQAKVEAPVQERRENEQQRKHPRVPEDLPRVPTAPLATKQKRSRRTPRTRSIDYFSKWLGIPGGDFGPNLHPLRVNDLNISKSLATSSSPLHQQLLKNIAQMQQVQDNRNVISFGRTNNIGSKVFGLRNSLLPLTGAQDAGISGVEPGPQIGRPLKVVSAALQAPNHQQLIETSTTEHQHPPLSDQMVGCLLRQIAEPQQQPDQQQLLEDDRERRTASGAGDSHLENTSANEDAPVEENTESFLSYEDDSAAGGTSTPFKASKRRGGKKKHERGFKFEEICSLHSSMAKVICCHFSSNGTLLASAGHEKKQVLIWNMETFDVVKTFEEHSHLITDVRFRPNSTTFATSSFDRNVKIWDAARPSESISKLEGHTEHVMSVDFHPRKFNLLSSCDSNDEIRLWNVNQSKCTRMFKGATKQVRFQPRFGKYLAAASGNSVNTFDVETASFDLYSKGSGHAKDVLSICWDTSGKYLASVSEDSARIWSTASSGKCIYELHSNGNKFQSCTFHPGYSLLLIIGCYESLELWSPSESNKTMTVPAHKGLVAALASSPKTDMVASGSHDQVVKLWK
ncbi:transcriptional corepressor LEUNIG_HOMOLOG isoform X1 [Rosa chinensis]|uniref:transcriptional corepressor LEUNIG_HOMOLOG isoform X1 n=1 Tax=Rosa chinensis TaxID=74649 RepID=UPI000D0877C8|nr:transcriptional corepressor LEUNIG_HOMOLOG isoform X1 [Rosa chinensis]XP_040362457.1 transcriptional corepressor LEUNIG_HOMOLOG isoform X1 [Rosa chinensis]